MDRLPIELWHYLGQYVPEILQVSRAIAIYERKLVERRIDAARKAYKSNPTLFLQRVIVENDLALWQYYWPRWCLGRDRTIIWVMSVAASRHCHYRALTAIFRKSFHHKVLDKSRSKEIDAALEQWVKNNDPHPLSSAMLTGDATAAAHLVVVNQDSDADRYIHAMIARDKNSIFLTCVLWFCIFYNRLQYGYNLYKQYKGTTIVKMILFTALRTIPESELSRQWRLELGLNNIQLISFAHEIVDLWRGGRGTALCQQVGEGFCFEILRPSFLLCQGMPDVVFERWPFPYTSERDHAVLAAMTDRQKELLKASRKQNRMLVDYYEQKFREHKIDF